MSFSPPGTPVHVTLPHSPDQFISTLGTLGQAAFILVLTFLAARLLSGRIRRLLNGVMPTNDAILLARVFWVCVWTVGVLFVLYKDKVGFTPLSAFIGVVGLAASLSLQTVLQNLVAGIYLLVERPFAIGDTISVIGPSGLNHEGEVQDIQMRTTHLRTRDDELILVPNAAIFSSVITNRTSTGRYVSQVTATFPRDRNPEEIRESVLSILGALPALLPSPAPQLHVEKVGKDDWTACISFWATSLDGDSGVPWALACAFPDVTVNEGLTP